jgi:opacity protein-like surface antigen
MSAAPSSMRRYAWVSAFGLALARASTAVDAAGFGVDFEGARSVGMATAGSASAADSSTIFYNPAGMTFLDRSEIMGGGQLFLLHDRFTNAGSTILRGALATPGNNGADAIPPTFIPWLYGSYRVNQDLAVGLGLFAPFGLKTDYGTDFVGRYQNELSALTVVDLNPALAYRLLPWLSIGAGLTVEYARLELTQAIDFGSACAGVLGTGPCAGAFGLIPGQSDGQTSIKGNDVSYGYSLGVMMEPVSGTRLGLNYRSRINHEFGSATQSFDVPAGARAFLTAGGAPTALTGSNVSTELPGARLTIRRRFPPRTSRLRSPIGFASIFPSAPVTGSLTPGASTSDTATSIMSAASRSTAVRQPGIRWLAISMSEAMSWQHRFVISFSVVRGSGCGVGAESRRHNASANVQISVRNACATLTTSIAASCLAHLRNHKRSGRRSRRSMLRLVPHLGQLLLLSFLEAAFRCSALCRPGGRWPDGEVPQCALEANELH